MIVWILTGVFFDAYCYINTYNIQHTIIQFIWCGIYLANGNFSLVIATYGKRVNAYYVHWFSPSVIDVLTAAVPPPLMLHRPTDRLTDWVRFTHRFRIHCELAKHCTTKIELEKNSTQFECHIAKRKKEKLIVSLGALFVCNWNEQEHGFGMHSDSGSDSDSDSDSFGRPKEWNKLCEISAVTFVGQQFGRPQLHRDLVLHYAIFLLSLSPFLFVCVCVCICALWLQINDCVWVLKYFFFYSFDTWMPLLYISHWLDVGINYIHYTNAFHLFYSKTQMHFFLYCFSVYIYLSFCFSQNTIAFALLLACMSRINCATNPLNARHHRPTVLFGRSQIGCNPLDVQAFLFSYLTLSLLLLLISYKLYYIVGVSSHFHGNSFF